MRKFCWFYLLVACGPELATTEDTSTGTSTSAGPTDADPPTTGTSAEDSTSSSTTGEPSTGEPTTGEPTTGDATTDAVCIDTFKHEEIPDAPMTCGLAPLCPGSEPLLFKIIGDDGWTTGDIERARCMAAAMRDRTPGVMQFRHYGGNAWEDNRTIELLGAEAIVAHNESSDFNVTYTERLVLIRPPGYFADCADGSASQIHKCLTEGVDVVCIDTLTCPD